MKLLIAMFLLISCMIPLNADSEMRPFPKFILSEYGRYIFKMIPKKVQYKDGKRIIEKEAFGVAYSINKSGEFEEMWRTSGWYTFEGYLSYDGSYFVQIGPWAKDQKNHTDLAIAFYNKGKLLKKYNVKELIKNPDHLEYSVSHYRWRPAIQSKPNGVYFHSFHLVMIDKTVYTFDIKSGEISSSGIDEKAKSSYEIGRNHHQKAIDTGQTLFETSTFKKEFAKHYSISKIKAKYGKSMSVYFDNPEWSADMTPKKEYIQPCMIEAVFPIIKDDFVEVTITPQNIDDAIVMCLSHPFVLNRFKTGGATRLRMRITGDRLHWNTPELQELYEKLKGKKIEDQKLKYWAYIIIDAKEPQFTSIYLNTKTGELIYEDNTKWPWEPILVPNESIN